MPNLAEKTALVTHACHGMNRATALALAAAGARVIIHCGRHTSEAKTVADHIRSKGGRADIAPADLTRPSGAHDLAARVQNLLGRRLDILVASTGVSKAVPFEDMTIEDFDELYSVNVRAPYFLVQQLLPVLDRGSSIVFLSSLSAHGTVGTLSAYVCTRGAINTLMKYFATMLGSRGIRVNTVASGLVDASMPDIADLHGLGESRMSTTATPGEPGHPLDAASAVTLLASGKARWGNGDTIVINGSPPP